METDFKVAGFWQRLASSYLSLFIYLLLALAVYNTFDLKEIKVFILLAFVFSLIDSLALAFSGYNLAGLLLGLKQVTSYEYKTLGLERAALHYLFSIFSLLILGLGYVVGFFNQGKRTLQDIVSDSVTLEAPVIPYVTKALAATFSLFAFVLTIVIPGFIALVLVLAFKSSLIISTIPYYSSPLWEANSTKVAQIALAQNKVVALTRLHPSDISYLPYTLDTKSSTSTINAKDLDELDLDLFDYIYSLSGVPKDIVAASIEDLMNIRIVKQVLVPELIMQDKDLGDVVIHDLLLKVADESKLARDVLDIFNYTIKQETLELSLDQSDAQLFSDTELEPAYREFLLKNLAFMHHKWQQALKAVPAALTEELLLSKKTLVNPVEITVEANTGFISSMMMTKPSESARFNEFCKSFVSSVKRLKPVPNVLSDRYPGPYNLKFDLERESQVL